MGIKNNILRDDRYSISSRTGLTGQLNNPVIAVMDRSDARIMAMAGRGVDIKDICRFYASVADHGCYRE